MNEEHNAKTASTKTGLCATLFALPRATGTTAPAGFRAPTPSRRAGRVPAVLCGLALALATTLALGATSASAAEPTVTIEKASGVKFTTAQVEGTVDPGGEPTTYRFQYATQADFSDAINTPEETIEGAKQTVKAELTGLAPNTTYHLRLLAENASNPEAPAEAVATETFTTKEVIAPELTIASASALTYHSAHVAGTVELANEDPAFNSTTCAFQYVTDTQFNAPEGGGFQSATTVPCEPGTVLGTEVQPVEVKADLNGLTPGTTYHLRLVANNLGGNSALPAANFETEAVAAPTATGLTVSGLTATSAHFEATVNAGGSGPGEELAVYSFQCSPACPGLPGPEPIVADGADHTVEATATGLEPNTPYTVTITVQSPGGQQSAEVPFTTEPLAPDATTLPFVGPASSEAARLYGTVNPHNSATTYFFEYGPADCASSPCASIPATEDAAVTPGNAIVTVSQDLTGLSPTTTYHFRIVAKSPAGTTPGQDQALITAEAPKACSAAEQQLRSENNSTHLSRCRAYERVTPAFKAGSPSNLPVISADGSRAIIASTALFAGGEGDSKRAHYESVRTPLGWSTSPITPPSWRFPAQERVDMSADLSRAVWEVRTSSQSAAAEDLALREPDGSFSLIGPLVPPALAEGPPAGEMQAFSYGIELVYAGSSPDLSRVFFEIKGDGPQWPADTTHTNSGAFSLYEYVGVGNTEPTLVGVDAEGHLISECSTGLGSSGSSGETESQDGYNAVSADGETVYFTATGHNANSTCAGAGHAPAVNELYAQVGTPPSAHNVAISEPSSTDCEACQIAEQAGAEFQGASEDGSVVFFLTPQELLPGNKGNNLYSYDFANPEGEKIVPVSTSTGVEEPKVLGVSRVSQDGSHVYFVAQGVLTEGPNAEGNSPTAGAPNLYVFERDAAVPEGSLAFIATLSEADSRDWSASDVRPVQATPDGRFLVFQSSADLTPGDTSLLPQVFEYDAVREELVRVSVGEPGYPPGAQSADAHRSSIPMQTYVRNVESTAATSNLALSDNGAVVVFESTAGLTPGTAATSEAGLPSVFEYRSTGALSNGSVFQVSNGSALFGSSITGTDSSGRDVFFRTLAPVLGSDGDTAFDVYDARDGGGFALAATPSDCELARACQGAGGPLPPVAINAKSATTPPVDNAELSRAQRLQRALRACRRRTRPGHKRRRCEAAAQKRYASAETKGRG